MFFFEAALGQLFYFLGEQLFGFIKKSDIFTALTPVPMNTDTCKNCTHTVEGNFCSNCGQTAHTHTLDWHYVVHEVQHGAFHVDKGLLYTIKELFLRPGYTIRQFIAGSRINYFKPVAMIIFLGAIYGFLYHYFEINIVAAIVENDKMKAAQQAAQSWIMSHYTLVVLLMIPIYSLGSKIAFMKSGYNYVEHLALNSFLAGLKLFLQILLLPLVYMWQNSNNIEMVLTLSFISDIALTVWVYGKFFNMFSVAKRALKIFLSYLLVLVFAMAIGMIGGIIIGIMSVMK